jgi:hypothetical protein
MSLIFLSSQYWKLKKLSLISGARNGKNISLQKKKLILLLSDIFRLVADVGEMLRQDFMLSRL